MSAPAQRTGGHAAHSARDVLCDAGTAATCRWGANAALCTLLGVVISGPLAVLVLSVVHPQPPWSDAAQFARHYHWFQSFPYFGGFLLVFGFVAMMASLHELAPREVKARATTALALSAAFAALVLLNYVIQTTFVANLARHYSAESAAIITAFSMVNPSSLAWAVEMWAYGFLGLATWLIAPVFAETSLEQSTAWLFVANGVVSIVAALAAAVDPAWMMTSVGTIAYAAWNLLVLAMFAMAYSALRRRTILPSKVDVNEGAGDGDHANADARENVVRPSHATASPHFP